MKKTTFFAFLFLLGTALSAQYSENFESYSCIRSNAQAECHVFSAFSLSDRDDRGAFDGCGVQSGQLTNPSANSFYRTPAINFTADTDIEFEHAVSNTSSNVQLTLVAIDVDNNSETILSGPTGGITTTEALVSVPSTLSGLYRLEFRAVGNGGSSRYNLDNISIADATLAEVNDGGGCELIRPTPEEVPSMGQWLTVFFGLMVASFSVFVLYRRKLA